MQQDQILLIDLGGEDNSEIARAIRGMGVYCEIQAHDLDPGSYPEWSYVKGVIYNGGNNRLVNGVLVQPNQALLEAALPQTAFACPDLLDLNQPRWDISILETFVFSSCKCVANWTMQAFIESQVAKIRQQLGSERVLLALSGGVDSSVVAALLLKAVGQQLVCIHVNNGLLRKGEAEQVLNVFGPQLGANLVYVDATERFLTKLANISEPEEKRKIIGNEFIAIFEEEAEKLAGIKYLAQGTIYSDVVESGTKTKKAIKAHHNVGGLPEEMLLELIEPVKYLYKDEVRACGLELGLPAHMIKRQPFPGPGLGVRVLGAITKERLEAVRESDAILQEEFAKAGLTEKVWQFFTAVPDFKSVGVKDGNRSFEYPVIIRAVHTVDAMTATIAHLDWAVLDKITQRIITEVPGVNRVCYDLTPKPTGTIEWE